MALIGYIATPTVREENEVILWGDSSTNPAGFRWRITGPVQVRQATQWPPKLAVGEYGLSDNPVLSTFVINDWRGGNGLYYYTDTEAQRDKFASSFGLDTLSAGGLTLGPAVITSGTLVPTGAADTQGVSTSLNGTLLGFYGTSVYKYVSGSWNNTAIDALPATPVGQPVWFKGTAAASAIYYPTGASGYSYHTVAQIAAAPPQLATDVATPTVLCFAKWDDKLYCVDTSFILYSSPNGAAPWTTLATIPVDTDVANPRCTLKVYVDSSGDSVLWAITHNGLFIYDAVNNKWFEQELTLPYVSVSTRIQSAEVFDNKLWVITDRVRMSRLTMGQQLAVDQRAGPGQPDGTLAGLGSGITAARLTDLTNLVATDNLMFALGYGGSGTQLLAHNGRGWHHLRGGLSADAATAIKGLHYLSNADGQYLWFNAESSSVYTHLQMYTVQLLEHPRVRSSHAYSGAIGTIVMPWYDGGDPGKSKTAVQMRLLTHGSSALDLVRVYYAVNGATSFTLLGTITTDATESSTIRFGTSNIGVAWNTIRFALQLEGGTGEGQSTAPIVEYMAFDFYRQPDTQRGFEVELDMTGDSPDGRTPQSQTTDFWNIISSTTLGTFAYRDDTGNTRSYMCKVLSPQGVEHTGHVEGGRYKIQIVEMGGNS